MTPGRVQRALAPAAIVALLACDGDRAQGERVVRAYNEAAVLAYRTRDSGPLRAVATPKEWGRVVVLVDLKAANRLVLESELERFEVRSAARPTPDLLVVETDERWSYFDRPLDPGAPRGTRFVADMRMAYELQQEPDGAWKVASTRTLSSTYREPPGFRPGIGGHALSADGPSADGARPREGGTP